MSGQWTREQPGLGVGAGIEHATLALQQREAVVSEVIGSLSRTEQVRAENWQGTASRASGQQMSGIIREFAVLEPSIAKVNLALARYAAEIKRIQQGMTEIESLRAQADTVSARQYPKLPTDAKDWQRAERRQTVARDGALAGDLRATADAQLAMWAEHRAAASRDCVAQINAARPVGWGKVIDGFRAGGVRQLSSLQGSQVMQLVALFSQGKKIGGTDKVSQAKEYALTGDYGKLDQLLGTMTPVEVAEWWDSLAVAGGARVGSVQDIVAKCLPERIGNLEGVEYWARDVANRQVLSRLLDGTTLTDSQRSELQTLQAQLTPLGGETIQLASLDVSDLDRPLAGVSIGDLDLASNVTFAIPGATSRISTHIGNNMTDARTLIGENIQHDASQSYAVLSWLGYVSPELVDVPGNSHAIAGGEKLRAVIAGYNARRRFTGGSPESASTTLTITAHSYGTLTAYEALRDLGDVLGVKSLVLIGSSGLPRSAYGDTLDGIKVFATEAAKDHTADVGRAGSATLESMSTPEYMIFPYQIEQHRELMEKSVASVDPRNVKSVEVFSSDAEKLAGKELKDVESHNLHNDGVHRGYLTDGTSALEHISNIVTKGKP